MRWTGCARKGGLVLVAALLGASLAGAAGAEASAEALSVLSAQGPVEVQGPRGVRELQCGEPLRRGARIATGPEGRASLGLGDLYLELGPEAAVRLTEVGRVHVLRGSVRAVDLGGAGQEVRVTTPHGGLRGAGLDATLAVGPERTEVCQALEEGWLWRANATGRAHLSAGSCAAIQEDGVVLGAAGPDPLALSGAAGCVDVDIASHFQPADVAAPPLVMDFFPLDPDKRTFSACDDPGSGCGGSVQIVTPPMPPPMPPPDFGFGTGPADPPAGNSGARLRR
mgnify:CR=1 FL=1